MTMKITNKNKFISAVLFVKKPWVRSKAISHLFIIHMLPDLHLIDELYQSTHTSKSNSNK